MIDILRLVYEIINYQYFILFPLVLCAWHPAATVGWLARSNFRSSFHTPAHQLNRNKVIIMKNKHVVRALNRFVQISSSSAERTLEGWFRFKGDAQKWENFDIASEHICKEWVRVTKQQPPLAPHCVGCDSWGDISLILHPTINIKISDPPPRPAHVEPIWTLQSPDCFPQRPIDLCLDVCSSFCPKNTPHRASDIHSRLEEAGDELILAVLLRRHRVCFGWSFSSTLPVLESKYFATRLPPLIRL